MKWKDLIEEKRRNDPGSVARVDQIRAEMEREHAKLRWVLVRWWDERRSRGKA